MASATYRCVDVSTNMCICVCMYVPETCSPRYLDSGMVFATYRCVDASTCVCVCVYVGSGIMLPAMPSQRNGVCNNDCLSGMYACMHVCVTRYVIIRYIIAPEARFHMNKIASWTHKAQNPWLLCRPYQIQEFFRRWRALAVAHTSGAWLQQFPATCVRMNTYACMHVCIRVYMYTSINHTHKHTHTHAKTHAHMLIHGLTSKLHTACSSSFERSKFSSTTSCSFESGTGGLRPSFHSSVILTLASRSVWKIFFVRAAPSILLSASVTWFWSFCVYATKKIVWFPLVCWLAWFIDMHLRLWYKVKPQGMEVPACAAAVILSSHVQAHEKVCSFVDIKACDTECV